MTQKEIPRGKRRQVFTVYPVCAYCGREYADVWMRHRTIDHKIPRSHGGTDDLQNLVGCCRTCNQAKRDRTPQQWAADILAAAEAWETRNVPDPEFVGVISDAPPDTLPPAFSAALEAVRERKGIAAQTTVEASAVEV